MKPTTVPPFLILLLALTLCDGGALAQEETESTFIAATLGGEGGERTLFFTSEERSRIEGAFQRAQPRLLAQAKHVLHCGSILYTDEEDWVVWLQGERWTPETKRATMQILSVEPESVTLSLLLPGETAARTVTLKAHQSLNLLTGAVVEGIYGEERR